MYDTKLELKDAGLVAADVEGKVGGVAQILDVGDAECKGHLIIDVTVIEIASNDELYKISLQGSSKSDFADTYEDLVILELGANEVLAGDQDSTIGRYKIPFTNERNGTVYRYLRSYTDVNGTIATGINYSAYLTD